MGSGRIGLVGDHDQYVISGYLQNERKLLANLSLTLGMRYDYQKVDTGFKDENWSPKIGLVWHARPWLCLRGSSGRGFRAASMSERFSDSIYSGLRLLPNPDLKSGDRLVARNRRQFHPPPRPLA